MAITENPHRSLHQIDGPWLTDKRWAGGRISDGLWRETISWWFLALLWNGITWPALMYGFRNIGRHRDETPIILIFPLIGLGMLAAAVFVTVRYLKFRRSHLELETLPGCVGGWLAGTVRTTARLADVEYVRLTLRCINRVTTGSGKNRSTRERTLWESEQVLGGRLPPDREGGHAIPVAFRIPPDASPTRDEVRDDIVWRLRVRVPLAGANYQSSFVVPVYGVQQPAGFVPRAEHEAARIRAPREALAVLDGSRLDIVETAAGRRRFIFPASRRRTAAMVNTFIALGLFSLAWAMVHYGAPVLAPIIAGFIGSLFAGAYVYWLRHVEFEVDRGGIEHRWRVFPLASQRRLPVAEIQGIENRVTTTVGDTPYFTVIANVADKFDSLRLVSGLRSGDAEQVRAEVMAALGQHVDHAERADEQTDHAIDREEREADL